MKPTVRDFEAIIEGTVYADISQGELDTTFASVDGVKEAAAACHTLAVKMAEEFAKGFAEWIKKEEWHPNRAGQEEKWFKRSGVQFKTTDQLYQDYLTSQTKEQ